ncbi:MAG TPA: DUF3488 and transglutaminase-like domain-containing protein [Planctomycetaceae bacterium]|nr:DUF3488 and transglutaminase-like domain-containing protein [Planctomycetaceae bacterium]
MGATQLAPVFFASIYLIAGFSGGLLAWAEGHVFPTGLSPLIALFGWWLNRQNRLPQIGSIWTNLLGLAAFVIPAFEFFGDNPEGRLLSAAHLLVYLQCILLLQKKQEAQYWYVCALCILQTAVASVLTNSAWFGALLAVFLLLSVWTLSVLTLYSVGAQFSHAAVQAFGTRLRPALAVAGGPGQSTVWNAVQYEPAESWISLRFAAGVLAMSGAALAVGMGFFLLIPRVWLGEMSVFQDARLPGGRPVTGFSTKIQLGQMGEILESTQPVMHVRFRNALTEAPVDIDAYAAEFGSDEPRFRGRALTRYQNGRWEYESRARPRPLGSDTSFREMVEQVYVLEPVGANVLFAMRPIHGARVAQGEVVVDPVTGALALRAPLRGGESIRYSIFSPRKRTSTLQHDVVSLANPRREREFEQFLEMPDLPRLRQKALELTADGQLPPGPSEAARRAAALEAWLRDSGEFRYTLSMGVKERTLDPVEDFLFERKAGHCEYFASALTLMLRAVDIPSRLVSGFKGGVSDRRGGYEVQQRHAHAWVEAYLNGDWVALDPTPAADREAIIEEIGASGGITGHLGEELSRFWSNYVLNLSLTQQREFYKPLWDAFQRLLTRLSRLGSTLSTLKSWFWELVHNPEKWFSWKGGVVVFLLLLVGWLIVSTIVRLVRWLARRHLDPRRRRAASSRRVEFYEAFTALLKARGWTRLEAQTQREFAVDVERALASRVGHELATAAPELTEAFYRVRFGEAELSPGEHQRLMGVIAQLEAGLAAAAR